MRDFPIVRVKHIPLRPPRNAIPGEGIYLALWQEWATARPRDWYAIFTTNGAVRQRAASVAASFMVFMGCNGGKSLTWNCERYASETLFAGRREMAFLAAWAVENMRNHGVNYGLRGSEYMLANQHPITNDIGFSRRVDWRLVPHIIQEDNDYLESMVRWWASDPAAVLRSIAEPMIEAENNKMRTRMFFQA